MNDTKSSKPTGKKSGGFSDFERAAMKERAQELKAEARKADGARDVLKKIAEMPEPDRGIAENVHELVTAVAPDLVPKLRYGMPTYMKDGKVLCFFQSAKKFDTRYSTLAFEDAANLDEGTMWPTGFALTQWTPANESKIRALVKKAVT